MTIVEAIKTVLYQVPDGLIFLTYIQIKRLLNLEIDSEEAAREKQLL